MVKVIETNLSLNPNDEKTIMDHQSRVIEVDSWESYVEEVLTGDSVYRKALFGEWMEGYSFPLNGIVEDFISDEHHLSYLTTSDTGTCKHLAYLIQ